MYTGEGLGPHVARRAGSWSGRGCARWEVCGTLTCVSGAVRTSSGASRSPVLPVHARPRLRSSPQNFSTWEVGTRGTQGPREVWGVGESWCMWMKGSLVEIKGPVLSSWRRQRSLSRPPARALLDRIWSRVLTLAAQLSWREIRRGSQIEGEGPAPLRRSSPPLNCPKTEFLLGARANTLEEEVRGRARFRIKGEF